METDPAVPTEDLTKAGTAAAATADRARCDPRSVQLVQLPPAALDALARRDLAAANAASPVPLSAWFVDGTWTSAWQRRSRQVAADPASAAWITRVIWDEQLGRAVGRAGFHGPPDATGMVEIGYTVDPAYRRRGYATAALGRLLQRAAEEPSVATVRVTISPDNAASYAVASQYGFAKVGEQWDDEDGLEIVYEVVANL